MAKICKISDSTNEIDLLDPNESGLRIVDFIENIAELKGDGVKISSPSSEGSQTIFGVLDDPPGIMGIGVVGSSQDNAIANLRTLLSMLMKARRYWQECYNTTPVYLIVKSDNETNSRYAIIKSWKAKGLPYPFEGPIESGATGETTTFAASIPNILVTIERGQFWSHPPGSPADLPITTEDYTLQDWEIIHTFATAIRSILKSSTSGSERKRSPHC